MADNNVGTIYYDIDVRTDKAIDAVSRVKSVNKNASDSFAPLATQTKKASVSMGALGKRAGQAGIQVQQFVGQVTTGTNVMTAMSMQAADLGFVLGFPLLGAVAGITASLAGPFITAIFNANSAASEFNDTIDDTIKGLKSTRIEAASGAIDVLKDRIKEAATEMERLNKRQTGRSAVSMSSAREEKRAALLKQQTKDTEALAEMEKRLADIRMEGADKLQTPIPDSDGFELTDYFAEQEKLRQDELDKRARYAQGVIAQMQQQSASETEAADTALDMQLQAIEEARTQKIELGQSYDTLEADAKQLHADKLAEIDAKRTQAEEAEAAKRLQAKRLELNAYSQLGGQLTGLMSSLGMEQTALGKAIFLANQAIAVAGIIVSTQQAAAQALTVDPSGGLSSRVTTLGYASAAIAAGVAVGETFSGRQTGGPTEAGTPYRVLEAGKPELFEMGGRDYLLGGQKGQVTPLSSTGAAAGTNVNITMINQGTQSEVMSDDGQGNITVRSFVADMDSRGPMFKSITRNTNATSKTK